MRKLSKSTFRREVREGIDGAEPAPYTLTGRAARLRSWPRSAQRRNCMGGRETAKTIWAEGFLKSARAARW
jgi:hypothetical protein